MSPRAKQTDSDQAKVAAIAHAPEPLRTRLLVLLSAWWTLAQMENTGTTLDELVSGRGALDELTTRLHALAADGLVRWPEAVLTTETREFIEAVVEAMSSSDTQKDVHDLTEAAG